MPAQPRRGARARQPCRQRHRLRRGKVTVEARWTRDQVLIEIRDDGPGFAPEVLLRVGEPYVTTRGGDRREREGGGGGLGLGCSSPRP
jgi:signal transduction histidine kinase